MAPKKITLPPKPSKTSSGPKTVMSPVKSPADFGSLKVTEYRVTLEDGTYLIAKGDHADLVFRYLNECEKHCAEYQLVNYLGPSLARYDAEGNVLAPSVN